MDNHSEPPWRNSTIPVQQRPGPQQKKRPANEAQEEAWVAGEDRFVLQQARKKAEIRVKEGRAKPIDWLAVTLRFIDTSRNPFDDEIQDSELDIVDPEGVFEGLDESQLSQLEKDITHYLTLEFTQKNKEFWNTMLIICKDKRAKSGSRVGEARGVSAVSSDVDRIFSSKSLDELKVLEQQIRIKLESDEPIDVDYWQSMLQSLSSWKARAKLRQVSQEVMSSQVQGLRAQQVEHARRLEAQLSFLIGGQSSDAARLDSSKVKLLASSLDPDPELRLKPEDKNLGIQDEDVFLRKVVAERQRLLRLGFVPAKYSGSSNTRNNTQTSAGNGNGAMNASVKRDETSMATNTMYEREAARGVGENEEVFENEEEVITSSSTKWSDRYKPRKPRYFNRVQMGYEWNKYNQTHYDHDNPPPKVVQGYKFNIFYPELMDKTRAPTYKIERENGRRKGQSLAPAGEEDTCLIRFIAGPPYEDIAFRIVDKEWDYSAKRERGFKSSFDKGVLQLYFQFKKVFYRK